MAITVDASIAAASSDGGSAATVGPFSAVTGQLILITASLDQNSQPYVACTISNDGTALSWTTVVNAGAADTGTVAAFYTHLAADRTDLSVTITRGDINSDSPCVKAWLLTDHDAADILGAATNTTSTTENLTSASITPETSGVGFGVGTDYTQSGTPTSSDLTNVTTFDISGDISAIHGYKALSAGVGATANFNANGTPTGAWRYAWFEIRAGAGGAAAGMKRRWRMGLMGCN